jgi:hypothetical protein
VAESQNDNNEVKFRPRVRRRHERYLAVYGYVAPHPDLKGAPICASEHPLLIGVERRHSANII